MIALHQKHIESLVELTVIQRKELRALVEKLPQLREELISEFEKQLETLEPQIRSEFQQFVLDKIGENKAEANAVLEEKLAELTDKVELAANDKYDAIQKQTEESRRFIGELSARIATQEKMLPEVVRTITDSRIAAFEAEQKKKPIEFEIPEPQGFNPRGVWDANETYERLDVVSYRGSSYVANERSRGERPSGKSRFWTQLAARAVGGGVAEGGGGGATTAVSGFETQFLLMGA